MRRFWVAALASLLLHAGALGAAWKILSVPSEGLHAVLVELPSLPVERLLPLRIRVQKTPSLPATLPRSLLASTFPSPPSRHEEAAELRGQTGDRRPISLQDEPVGAASQDGLRSAAIPVDAEGIGASLGPILPSPGPLKKVQGVTALTRLPSSEPALRSPASAEGSSRDWGYLSVLRSKVQGSVVYPPTARRRGLAGIVELEIQLRLDGSVEKITVVRSSGHALLDEAAARGVEEAAPFPPPGDLPRGPVTVLLPLAFELR